MAATIGTIHVDIEVDLMARVPGKEPIKVGTITMPVTMTPTISSPR